MTARRVLLVAVLGSAIAVFAESSFATVEVTTSANNNTGGSTTLSTLITCEDKLNSVCRVESQWEYEDVAASQTDQVIGGIGAIGDLVSGVYCAMSAASAGTVSIKDGSGSSFVLFQAQPAATVVQTQPLNWVSTSGAWKLTTGTNTTCRVSGRFN